MKIRQFRKKPIVIEAVRLEWETWNEMCDFVGVGKIEDGKPEGRYVTPNGTARERWGTGVDDRLGLLIPTLEGVMLAVEGDWIIKGVKGEFYPCKPDIFEETYEEVEA